MLEDNLLAVLVNGIDGLNDSLHALERDFLQVMQLLLQFLGFSQSHLVFSIFEKLSV